VHHGVHPTAQSVDSPACRVGHVKANTLVLTVGSVRVHLVACKESNQALESRKPIDWIPGPSLRCVPHAAQSTSGAGLGETSESSVSPEPPSSRAILGMRRTRGCRRQRWRELRLCGEKAAREFRSPPALPAPYFAQRSPLKFRPAISPKSSSSPSEI
jgi:hypothetical protein